jgi:hypothetical protein
MAAGPAFRRIDQQLAEILGRWGLEQPDKRPLYAYRATEVELESLRRTLRTLISRSSRFSLSKEEAAGLCLYIAEAFSRRHDSGSWRWDVVLDDLCPGREGPELYESIRLGLRFWRRKLHELEGRKQYLVTLACEGGLPLGLLRNQNSSLFRYFRQILQDVEHHPAIDARDSSRHFSQTLPRTLQLEEVFQLAGELVEGLVHARRVVGNRANPIRYLDEHDPTWRQGIPLRLEDGLARKLIEGLITAPTTEGARPDSLSVVTWIRLDAIPRIERELRAPQRLPLQDLSRLLELDQEQLPRRFGLALIGENGAIASAAKGAVASDGGECTLQALSGRAVSSVLTQVDLEGQIDLALTLYGNVDLRVPVVGGEALPADAPWIFRDEGKAETGTPGRTGALLGTGSLSTTAPRLLVGLPEGWEWESVADTGSGDSNSAESVEVIAELASFSRRWIRVQGNNRLVRGDERIQLRTRQSRDSDERFLLRGPCRQLGSGGSRCWLGLPEVVRSNAQDWGRSVARSQVEWRPLHGRTWSRKHDQCLGQIALRVIEDGHDVFRTRLTVLPSGCDPRTSHADEPNRGLIELPGIDARKVIVDAQPGLDVEVHEAGSDVTIDCRIDSASSVRPGAVEVLVQWDQNRRAALRAPFPGKDVAFVDVDGTTFENGASAGIDSLHGVRVRVVGCRPRDTYFLEAVSQSTRMPLGEIVEGSVSGTRELSLDSVLALLGELLEAEESLDATVVLRIGSLGVQAKEVVSLEIARFDAQFGVVTAESGRVVSLEPRTGKPLPLSSEVAVIALPIWSPADRSRLKTVGGGVAGWVFDDSTREPGPWLVTAWRNGLLVARPLLVVVSERSGAASDVDDSTELRSAVRRNRREDRVVAIDQVVDRLARDPDHPDWKLATTYLETVGHLPSDTFDFVRQLIANPNAVALAALKCAHEDWFERFWSGMERLRFSWAAVPVCAWAKAVGRKRDHLEHALFERRHLLGSEIDADSFIASDLDGLEEATSQTLPGLDPICDAIRLRLLQHPPRGELLPTHERQGGRDVLFARIEDARQGLRRRKHLISPGEWPRPSPAPDAILGREGLEGIESIPRLDPTDEAFRHVLDAPVVAAAISVYGERPNEESMAWLQLLRAFDAEWFDTCHALALTLMVGFRMREEERYPYA